MSVEVVRGALEALLSGVPFWEWGGGGREGGLELVGAAAAAVGGVTAGPGLATALSLVETLLQAAGSMDLLRWDHKAAAVWRLCLPNVASPYLAAKTLAQMQVCFKPAIGWMSRKVRAVGLGR